MSRAIQLDPQDHASTATDRRRAAGVAVAFGVAFAVVSTWMSVRSAGFLESDGCVHYMIARHAFAEPHYFVNIWGRPFKTLLFSVPAQLGGLTAVRATGLACAIGVAMLAWRSARALGFSRPWLAFVLVLGQPLVFLHSFSELTELPFALLLAGAFLAYIRRSWAVFAILAGLLPTCRPEGFGFLPLAWAALAGRRAWHALPLTVIPLLGWTVAGAWLWNESAWWGERPWWLWLKRNWPYSGESAYQRGTIFRFVLLMPAIVGPFAWWAVVAGAAAMVAGTRRRGAATNGGDVAAGDTAGGDSARHLRHCRLLVVALPAFVLVAHSVLYATGKMASSGEPRYMLVVAGFWGLLASRGWDWAADRLGGRFPRALGRPAGVTVLVAVLAALPLSFNAFYGILPLRNPAHFQRAESAVSMLRSAGPLRARYPNVMASHPGVAFGLDVSPNATRLDPDRLRHPPKGTILVWDSNHGSSNADRERTVSPELLAEFGWVEDRESSARLNAEAERSGKAYGRVSENGEWHVYFSPLDATGAPTPPDVSLTRAALALRR